MKHLHTAVEKEAQWLSRPVELDCNMDLAVHNVLNNQFDNIASNGNVVQCGQIADVGTDTTSVALGYGETRPRDPPLSTDPLGQDSLIREAVPGVSAEQWWPARLSERAAAQRPPALSDRPASPRLLRGRDGTRAAEDKTFRGASARRIRDAGRGDFTNGVKNLNNGYHRVWGRDLYQQATGLIARRRLPQALRMAQFMWNNQYIQRQHRREGRHIRPVRSLATAGSAGSVAQRGAARLLRAVGQDAFAIVLASMTG